MKLHVYKDRTEIKYFLNFTTLLLGGHRGVNKTYNATKEKNYWKCMKKDIQYRIKKLLDLSTK